ncbi:hypothetical protein AC578_2090 [Pseudocercospora eumusae]|uniref:Uncharacterized protein n=1 Tax=Pseudocercospora eumusae TaxID=321146 RepID=A0A139HQF8_9PEZI|nr:hypothetical protein AC578_2090 [Pseudocercospora eumusae]
MGRDGSRPKKVTTLQDLNDDVLREILDIIPAGRSWQETLRRAELHGNASIRRPPSDLVNFCSTCHRLRDLGTPYIFSAASLTPYSNGRQASSLLRMIGHSRMATRQVKKLSIALVHHVPGDFGHNLCLALQSLPAMHDLTLVLPEQSRPLVWTCFQQTRLCLPQVKTLAFMPFDTGAFLFHFAETVLGAFPGLSSLSVRKLQESGKKTPFFTLDASMKDFLSLVCRIHSENLQSLTLQLSGTPSDYASGFTIRLPNLTSLWIKDYDWFKNLEQLPAKFRDDLRDMFPKLAILRLGVTSDDQRLGEPQVSFTLTTSREWGQI